MYKLIDSGDFKKLEQVGPYKFVRPSPQAVWRPRLPEKHWSKVDAYYTRFSGGDGKWTINSKLPEQWKIKIDNKDFVIRLTDFGHLGLFAEQRKHWLQIEDLTKSLAPQSKVLNLFAYTGGSTLAAADGGAQVVHVDASKTSNAWARDNALARNLQDAPIRWITEDVKKFVEREVRRKSTYHGVILDPPSFGRGAKNEIWKIETDLPLLLSQIKTLLDPKYSFILLSSHSHGYTPLALKNLLLDIVEDGTAEFECDEMTVKEEESGRQLPSGAYCLMRRNSAR